MLQRWRRIPLSGKGCGAYHRWMPDETVRRLTEGRALPMTFVVSKTHNHWHVAVYYHGLTVAEALHPVLVAEQYLDHNRVPAQTTWRDLYREVALAIEDLAEGVNVKSYVL